MQKNRLEQLKAFLKESPDEPFILFAIAKEYEKLKDQDSAMNYYEQIVQIAPNYVGVYYHLGKLLEKQNRINEAFQTYKEGMAVAQQQGDRHALNELAAAKLNLGDDEDFD